MWYMAVGKRERMQDAELCVTDGRTANLQRNKIGHLFASLPRKRPTCPALSRGTRRSSDGQRGKGEKARQLAGTKHGRSGNSCSRRPSSSVAEERDASRQTDDFCPCLVLRLSCSRLFCFFAHHSFHSHRNTLPSVRGYTLPSFSGYPSITSYTQRPTSPATGSLASFAA